MIKKKNLSFKLIFFSITIFMFLFCSNLSAKTKLDSNSNEVKPKIVNGFGMEFVFIKPGSFIMGRPLNPANRSQHHDNLHRVTLTKGFYLMTTEVSQSHWKKVKKENPSFFEGNNLPVDSVTFTDVIEFIDALNKKDSKFQYSLPTSSQWEYAYRADTITNSLEKGKSNQIDNPSWYMKTGLNGPMPVGSGKPNAYGLYDMEGNVGEWCNDWYESYWKRSFWEEKDPIGPKDPMKNCKFVDKKLCKSKVIRGCSWDINTVTTYETETTLCPPYGRAYGLLDTMRYTLGFRLILIPNP